MRYFYYEKLLSKNSLYEFTFSSKDIFNRCIGISSESKLIALLKESKILKKNGQPSSLSIDNDIAFLHEGVNYRGKEYFEIRYTLKGLWHILEYLNQEKLYSDKNMKIIKEAEVRYLCKDNDTNNGVEQYVIISFGLNDENNFYEFNQKFKDEQVLVKLLGKIYEKGIIDMKYWTNKSVDELHTGQQIYLSDADFIE